MDGSFPRSSTLVGNTAHSLLLNSSRLGRGRSHPQGEAQSRRRRGSLPCRAGSRAEPARTGAAAAGCRCARAGGRRGGPEAGRAGARAARALSLPPRTLARPPAARPPSGASHWLTRALGPAATAAGGGPAPQPCARPQRRRRWAPPGSRAGAFLEQRAGGEPFQPPSLCRWDFSYFLPALGPAVRCGRALALSPAPNTSVTRTHPRCNFSSQPSSPHPQTEPQPQLAYPFLTSEIVNLSSFTLCPSAKGSWGCINDFLLHSHSVFFLHIRQAQQHAG